MSEKKKAAEKPEAGESAQQVVTFPVESRSFIGPTQDNNVIAGITGYGVQVQVNENYIKSMADIKRASQQITDFITEAMVNYFIETKQKGPVAEEPKEESGQNESTEE